MNPHQDPNDRVLQPSAADRIAVGVFFEREKVEAAINDLHAAGFSREEIGVVARTDMNDWGQTPVGAEVQPGGLATGAAAGAVAGAGLGGLWALGIAAGLLPAIGPVIAGGILASTIASATAGAAAGGLAGGLIGLGLSTEEAEFYEREISSGKMVVTVRAGHRTEDALAILRSHGGYDLHTGPGALDV